MPSDLQFSGPDGRVEPSLSTPSDKSPWTDCTGNFDDSGQSGIAILSGSTNPGFTLPGQCTVQLKRAAKNGFPFLFCSFHLGPTKLSLPIAV